MGDSASSSTLAGSGTFDRLNIGGVIDGAVSVIDSLAGRVPADAVLLVAVAATAMVGWWLVRKLLRSALYAAVVGMVAWWWYFGFPD